jgi:hypothetical protein
MAASVLCFHSRCCWWVAVAVAVPVPVAVHVVVAVAVAVAIAVNLLSQLFVVYINGKGKYVFECENARGVRSTIREGQVGHLLHS